MNCQMIRVISSPSSSTTGLATLILGMPPVSLPTLVSPRPYRARHWQGYRCGAGHLAAGEAAADEGWSVAGDACPPAHLGDGSTSTTAMMLAPRIARTTT